MAAKKTQPKPAPADEQEPAEAGDEQTTDYTRRAGGYVLTERGWVLEKK